MPSHSASLLLSSPPRASLWGQRWTGSVLLFEFLFSPKAWDRERSEAKVSSIYCWAKKTGSRKTINNCPPLECCVLATNLLKLKVTSHTFKAAPNRYYWLVRTLKYKHSCCVTLLRHIYIYRCLCRTCNRCIDDDVSPPAKPKSSKCRFTLRRLVVALLLFLLLILLQSQTTKKTTKNEPLPPVSSPSVDAALFPAPGDWRGPAFLWLWLV